MRTLIFVLGLSLAASPLSADDHRENSPLTLTWADTKEFSDLDSGRSNQTRFEEHFKNELTETFDEVARGNLPEGYKMSVVVQNVDLAGDTRFSSGRLWDVRIMKPIHSPYMKFDLVVEAPDGSIVVNKTETVRDFSYLDRASRRSGDQFAYEKHMIKRWGKLKLSKLVTG